MGSKAGTPPVYEMKWPLLRVRQAKDGPINYTMQRGIADWWLDNEARPMMEVRSI